MTFTNKDILASLIAHRDRIAASVWIVVRDRQVAEDIFQNVALKAITKHVTFEDESLLQSWAFTTARREAIDWARRNKRLGIGLTPDILELLEQEWVDADRAADDQRSTALRQCLGQLPGNSRELLELRYFQGMSCTDVAESVGMHVNAVYKRLSRLHQKLKECVEQRLADGGIAGA